MNSQEEVKIVEYSKIVLQGQEQTNTSTWYPEGQVDKVSTFQKWIRSFCFSCRGDEAHVSSPSSQGP